MRGWKFAALVMLAPVAVYGAVAAVKGRDAVWSTLLGPPRREPVDFTTWDRAPRPNAFILCPADLCPGETHGTAPVFPVPPAELHAAWEALAARKPHTRQLARDEDLMQGDWEVRTPVLRFPDTVTVRILPAGPGRSTLAVYSRAHYGYGDLGVNGRRMRAWLDELRTEVEG